MKKKNLFKHATIILLLCLISATLFAQTGLIGLWHLDGNTNDSIAFGHNGTIVGTVTQTTGRFGSAYHFDGNSYIDCGNVDLNSTGEFSISVWVKSTDPYVYEVWRMVVSKLGSSGGPLELHLGDGRNSPGLQGTATNYMAWNGGIGLYYTFSPYDLTRNAKDGAWHHLAVTFKSGSQIVYFDGVQVGSSTSSTPLPNTNSNFRIGGTFFGSYHKPLIGDIDEVQAYNRALSYAEIQILAQGGNLSCQNTGQCLTPTGLTTTNVTLTKATINWTKNPCAVKYRLQGRPQGVTNWQTFTLDSGKSSFNATGLTSNITYEWRIASVCQTNPLIISPYSSIQTFTTSTSVISGLIGIWHLDGNTNDSIAFGHNGTIVGTVTQTTGRFGYGYHFNGSSYIDCGNVDLNSTGEFSVSVWVKSTDSYITEVWRMVLSKLDYTAGGPLELFLGDGRAGNIGGGTAGNYIAWNGGIGLYNVYSPYDLTRNAKDGNWHHLAVTFKSTSQIVYFDGVQVASGSSTTALPNTNSNFHIGGTNFGPYHHPWIGDIDEVSAYNRALSSSEIQILAQGGGSLNSIQTFTRDTNFMEAKTKKQTTRNLTASIYPNPANTILNISMSGNASKAIIKIYDAQSRELMSKEFTGSNTQLTVSQLTAGMYFIRIIDTSGKLLYNGKFVKQ